MPKKSQFLEQECGWKAREFRVLIRLVVTADEAEAAELPRLFLSTTIRSSILSSPPLGHGSNLGARSPRQIGTPSSYGSRNGPITAPHFLVAARFLPWIPWPQSFEDRALGLKGLLGGQMIGHALPVESRRAASTRRLLRSPYRIRIHAQCAHPLGVPHGGRDACPRTAGHERVVEENGPDARRQRCYCSRAEPQGMVPEYNVPRVRAVLGSPLCNIYDLPTSQRNRAKNAPSIEEWINRPQAIHMDRLIRPIMSARPQEFDKQRYISSTLSTTTSSHLLATPVGV
ncbi:hypothetical protein DFH06DRAFT_1358917 [Mycena polygramma]|nr:hypothetical protein DFH06DRAFT_1358917 [Mycena polygramma]